MFVLLFFFPIGDLETHQLNHGAPLMQVLNETLFHLFLGQQ